MNPVGAGALALQGEPEEPGLIQLGEEAVSGGLNKSIPIGRSLRWWSWDLHNSAW